MNLNISGIKDQFSTVFQFAAQKTGEIGGHFVSVFKQGLGYARQDDRVAMAVLAVGNVLFFEMVFLNASIAEKVLSFVVGADSKLTHEKITAKNLIITTFALTVFALMNITLAKGLESNLSFKAIIGVYSVTCMSYFFLRLWRVSGSVKPPDATKSLEGELG